MRQAERVERSTRALLDAAAELIIERGYDGVSLAAVGERSGFSRGLVGARFGSKEGLIAALIERTTIRWRAAVLDPNLVGSSGLDKVVIAYRAMADQWEHDPTSMLSLWSLVLRAVGPDLPLRQRCLEHHDDTRRTVATWLSEGQVDGSVRIGVDPVVEATHELAVLRGLSYQMLLDRTAGVDFDTAAALRHAGDAARRRLGTD